MTAPKRILIAEISPLRRLVAAGENALDRLFDDGAEVWIADLVEDEIMRGGAETEALRAWVTKNRARIRIVETTTSQRRRREIAARNLAVRLWNMAGRPADLEPIARQEPKKTAEEIDDDAVWVAFRTASAIVDAASNGDIVLADDDVVKAAIAARMRRKSWRGRANLVTP